MSHDTGDYDGPRSWEDDERLSPRASPAQIVAAYLEACATIRSSFAALAEAEEKLNSVIALGDRMRAVHIKATRCWHRDDYTDVDAAIANLRRDVWGVIVERLELRRMMSNKRWAQLEAHLEKGDLPEITEASVISFAKQFQDELPQMLTEMVGEVFDFLRPPRSRYKTNSELEVPSKVIIGYVVHTKIAGKGFCVDYERQQKLTTLGNVFSALDGKGSIAKTHRGPLVDAIEASGPSGSGATEYFKFRCFENGNLHLWFLRADLLKRFNMIAGGRCLRPGSSS